MFHVLRGIVRTKDIIVKKVDFVLNKRVLLSVLIVAGISGILAGCLAYIFSDSLFTVFCGLIIGVTIGVLLNYFILTSYKIIKKIDIELEHEDEEEPRTVMQIK